MNAVALGGLGGALIGCLSCNAELRDAILEHRFLLLLLTIAPITLAGGALAAELARMVARNIRIGLDPVQVRGVAWSGAMIGAGAGGLFDSILLHEILQVHDMVSNSLPPVTFLTKSVNVFWSGIFDLSVFALIIGGIASLRSASQGPAALPPRFFWGSFLFGWGLFNCLDVLFFHGVLRYHDIVEVTDVPLVWNVAWWIMGAVIAIIGFVLMRGPVHTPHTHRL